MKSFSVRVPDVVGAKLAAFAKRHQLSKSAVARLALETYLNGAHGKRLSALDLAGDLVGCLKGRTDLSTNPKYMKGFGR